MEIQKINLNEPFRPRFGENYLVRVGHNVFVSQVGRTDSMYYYFDDVKHKRIFKLYEVDELAIIHLEKV